MLRYLIVASLGLTLACDGQEKPAPNKVGADKKGAAKTPPKSDKADKAAPADKAKKADDKAAPKPTDAATDKAAPKDAPPAAGDAAAAKPLEVSHDKSGGLARAAAVLEAEGIDNEDLRALSHHAEKLPTNAVVCKHLADVHKEGDVDVCVEELEHVIARLGPELYAEVSTCLLAASTVPTLDACFATEKATEAELHTTKHGDGIDKETCEKFFVKFEQLAMEAAADEKEHVKKALDTVKEDIVAGCMEQGTKAETDCVEKAKTLHEIKECAAS